MRLVLLLVLFFFFIVHQNQHTQAFIRAPFTATSNSQLNLASSRERRVRNAVFSFFTPSTLRHRRQDRLRSSSSSESISDSSTIEQLVGRAHECFEEGCGLLNTSDSLEEIEAIRVGFLGKNGKITALMKTLRGLPKEDKPKVGDVINRISKEFEGLLKMKKEELRVQLKQKVAEEQWLGSFATIETLPYLATPPGSRHPISLVMDLATDIFESIGYELIMGAEDSPEIETDYYNFEALGMPKDHPARNMQDTFYINTTGLDTNNETMLLRTHTSSVQIRQMKKRTPPFKIVAPGRVYRKDDIDATHYPIFHQVEILAMDKFGKLTMSHLLGTVKYFLQKMFGQDIQVRYRPSYFPFTKPSVEVDIFFHGEWLEVLGCGMVDPVVLENVGYDPEEYSGFAAGFGVERFAMIMHNITDIRSFWTNDFEFLEQFSSIPYEPASDEPQEEEIPTDIESIYATDDSEEGWFSDID